MSQEPIKKTNTSSWMTALKEYNAGKQWCVPKKGTAEYEAVKSIADKLKSSAPPVEKKSRVRKPKVPLGDDGAPLTITISPAMNGTSGNETIVAPTIKRSRKSKVKNPLNNF